MKLAFISLYQNSRLYANKIEELVCVDTVMMTFERWDGQVLLLFQVSHPRSPFLRHYFTIPIENWIHTSSDWITVVWSYFETTENRQEHRMVLIGQ